MFYSFLLLFFGWQRRRRLVPTFFRYSLPFRCAQPMAICVFGWTDWAKEYCHQKLITIKISGKKSSQRENRTNRRKKVLDECPTMGTNMSSAGGKRLNKTKARKNIVQLAKRQKAEKNRFRVFLPLIRLRMMNHATSAVFAIKSPTPIKAMPNTRSFGSASSSLSSL